MVLLLLCLLAYLGRRKRPRLARTLGLLALLLVFAVGCGPVPGWLMRGLQGDYASAPSFNWGARNAIVLLGAGSFKDAAHGTLEPSFFANGRILAAVAQYQSCHLAGGDCKVLASGGDPQGNGAPEAAVYRDALVRAGVPAADVLVEERSLSTFHNAQYSKPMLDAYAPQRTVLVTSGLHMRRSLLYFDHFGIEPTPVRGDLVEPLWSFYPLSWNFTVTDAALHEYVGIARFHVYNALGLNAPKLK
ncbi:YdcF family protein [Dyella sp. 2RAB6]|uniref:YdcF family protein n=1 Tax=Dyella sp. 2RAB6 TaxID=3232992 RepID=UPI003F9331C8